MNILFDLGHPAHFHLFKNFIKYLKGNGHNVVIVTREKDVMNDLLNKSGFEYLSLTKPGKGLIGMLLELLVRDIKVFNLYRKYRFEMGFGTSVSIAHLSVFTKHRSYNFNEDDEGVSLIYETITYPFTTKIISPVSIKTVKKLKKRIQYHSYHELAYLHPDIFTPDEKVLKKYNLKKHQYVIIRKNTLKASHDVTAKGLGEQVINKVLELVKPLDVIYTIEGNKSHKIEPTDMHHVIAFSKFILSDSQTMSEEAAVLGTPSLRMTTFVGKCGVLDELEFKYDLTYGFKPDSGEELIRKVMEFMNNPNLTEEWQEKRKKLLKEKVNFNNWIIDFFENERKDIEKQNQ